MTGEMKRLALVERLIEVLGKEPALTLMEHLPPTTWDQLATKDDVKMAATELRGEFAELRGEFGELRGEFGELRGEFGELRGEFGEQFGELRGEFGELRGVFGELRGEFGELRGESREHRGELALQIARQTRTIVFTQLGVALTIWIALLVPAMG